MKGQEETYMYGLINSQAISDGLIIAAVGFTGVFAVLVLFFALVKVMTAVFSKKQ